jgi:hypothetical protein
MSMVEELIALEQRLRQARARAIRPDATEDAKAELAELLREVWQAEDRLAAISITDEANEGPGRGVRGPGPAWDAPHTSMSRRRPHGHSPRWRED